MQDPKSTIKSIIEELRIRISQLEKIKDEEFLQYAEELAKWIFNLKELREAVEYFDRLTQQQFAIITKIGETLESELKKEWKVILSYKVNLSLLGDTEKFYYQQLEKAFNNEINLDFQDAYNFFRIVNMNLLSLASFKDKILSGNKVTKNDKGEIIEFVPKSIYQAWAEVREASDLFREQREGNPQGTVAHLRQLIKFKDEYEWRNSFKNWREIYGKNYYLPRLNQLSNAFYDYYLLNLKPSLDMGIINKLEVKDVKYDFNNSRLEIKPNFGSISFDEGKSYNKNHLMGQFVQILISNQKGTEIKQFESVNSNLNNNLVSSYRTTLNTRFSKAFNDGAIKLFLFIESIIGNKNKTKYALKAYRFKLMKETSS